VYVVFMFLFYFYCMYVLLWHINFPPGINKVNQSNIFKVGEMWVPPEIHPVPGICHHPSRYHHGPEEGGHCHQLATTHQPQRTATLSGIHQFLSPFHQRFQSDQHTHHVTTQTWGQVSVLDHRYHQRLWRIEEDLQFSSYPHPSWSRSSLPCGSWRFHLWGRSCPFPAAGEPTPTPSMCLLLQETGNRELLAIKLTLEEWRHWLEGAQHPFVVITDHRNLEYLCEARQLNTYQARWALFFTRFNFKVTYRPGHKNVKVP